MSNRRLVVEAAFGKGPFDSLIASDWIQLTDTHGSRAKEAAWTIGRDNELEHFPGGTATVRLRNLDRALDPDNPASVYAGDLLPLVPVRIRSQDMGDLSYDDEFYGYVRDGWKQILAPKGVSDCQLDLIDLLGVIDGYTLPDVLTAEILADSPVAYWSLDETRGSAMRDLSGNVRDGSYVAGTTELATRVESQDGVSVTGFDLDGEHWGQIRDAAATTHERPACLEVVFKPNSEVATQILYRSGTGSANEGNTIQYTGTGTEWSIISAIRDGDANNGVNSEVFSTSGAEGGLHHYVHRRPSAGDAIGYLDGVDVTLSNFTAPANGIAVAAGSVIGAADYETGRTIGGGTPASPYLGFIGGVAIYDADIGTARIEAHASAALAPLAGLTSDQHIEWALDQIGVPAGIRNLESGVVVMGVATTAGRNALEWMREVTATEGGQLYVDHRDGGKIRYTDRYYRFLNTRSASSQATFADDAGTPHIRYAAEGLDIAPNGLTGVVNQVTADWIGGTTLVEDTTSIGAYGPRQRTIETVATTPSQAQSAAEWLIARYKDPRSRVRGVTVAGRATRDRDDTVEGLQIDDRITFRVQPGKTGAVTEVDLFVDGVVNRAQGVEWETSFRFAPVDTFVPWIWGTSEWDETTAWG